MRVIFLSIGTSMKKRKTIIKKTVRIYKNIQKLNHEDLLFLFDINFLYPRVMSLMDSIHHKIETSFVFTEGLKDQLIKISL